MLPACATVGVAFSSKAFARQTTKIGKVQKTIARSTSDFGSAKTNSVGKSVSNISEEGKLYNDFDGSLAGVEAEEIKSLWEMLEDVSSFSIFSTDKVRCS